MRKEQIICDRCGAQLQKDTGAWLGAEVVFEGSRYTGGAISLDTGRYDLCARCFDLFKRWIHEEEG